MYPSNNKFHCNYKLKHRTSTFGLGRGEGGGVTLLPEKKLQNARKRQLYIRTQIAVKTV